jgi:hypothetical protein
VTPHFDRPSGILQPNDSSGNNRRTEAQVGGSRPATSTKLQRLLLDFVILILFCFVAYLSYAFISSQFLKTEPSVPPPVPSVGRSIQVEVLNGCGVPNVASKVTSYLRGRGIDVVDVRNYKASDVKKTLVIDRVGNLAPAKQIAQILGIGPQNVIQQLNPDYFVQVSVVVGKDFQTLKFMQ